MNYKGLLGVAPKIEGVGQASNLGKHLATASISCLANA